MKHTTDDLSQQHARNVGRRDDQDEDEPRAAYDFSTGVRGKHAQAMRRGYITTVHRLDGTTTETLHLPLPAGADPLDSEVWSYLSDPDTLVELLRLMQQILHLAQRHPPQTARPHESETG